MAFISVPSFAHPRRGYFPATHRLFRSTPSALPNTVSRYIRRAHFHATFSENPPNPPPEVSSPTVLDPLKARTPVQRYFETFTWRGYSINYFVDGPVDGEPVLIIHGFGASINHFRKNIPSLVATGRLRVFVIDLLGFGGSEKPSPNDVTYSLELWRDLVVDFISAQTAMADRKWAFYGNSIGSLISLMAADRLGPSHVSACVLINCAGGLVSFRYSELNPFQSALFWLFNTLLFNRFTGPRVFENFRTRENVASVLKQVYVDETAITDELLDILCEPACDEGACAVFLAILNADAGPKPEDILPQLTWCPMLVLWGEKDPWTPYRQGMHPGIKFPEYHPGIILKEIPNGGHCLHDERPDEVNSFVVPFLLEPKLKDVAT